ncbi:MAG: hypothetical protein HY515_04250 [Candidatus Aenigmarchaeota archaeon]|nr:hypothetical protein [Candidatus Aenigmarchaeota archaeon]
MSFNRYVSAIALAFALSAPAEAQSIATESLVSPGSPAKKSKVLRFDGSYNKGDFSAFGFIDFLGKFGSFYGEL